MKHLAMRKGLFILSTTLLVLGSGSINTSAQELGFDGFTWNQVNAFNQARLLGNGAVIGGVTFSSGLPAQDGSSAGLDGFPSSGTGYNPDLTLGHLTQLSGTPNTTRFINLPLGNDGTSIRHGVELSYDSAVGLPNLPGNDLLVFESGSTLTDVEGMMIRLVYNGQGAESATSWYYQAPVSVAALSTGGLFTFAYDASDLGVPENALITRVQIANLIATDTVLDSTPVDLIGLFAGEGQVVFDGSGTLPDKGPLAGTRFDRIFSVTQLDPDPLYVTGLHDVLSVPEPSTFALIGLGGALMFRRRKTC